MARVALSFVSLMVTSGEPALMVKLAMLNVFPV